MMQQCIILSHVISKKGIKVDKVTVDLIVNLPPPKNVRDIRSFLRHAGFYRRLIKNFSKIAQPLTNFQAKDVSFVFIPECLNAFKLLTELISTPIINVPDWSQPFKLMCDATDYVIGAVLD